MDSTNEAIEKSIQSVRTDKATLEQILKSCIVVLDECTINLDQSGLWFKALDPSHVSLIDMRLPNSIFQSWNVSKEISFHVDAKLFLKIVKSLDKKQSVLLEIFDNELKISNKESGTLLKLQEGNKSSIPVPKINFDQKITSTQSEFLKVLKSIDAISDYVTIEKTFDYCYVTGKGDQGSSKNELSTVFNFGISQTISESTYSFEYLMPFLKTIPKDQIIEFEFSSTKPCRLTTKLNNLGTIQFYLAPRVEN
ncbi:hypothetical protein HOV56_gp44 [Nitrosopumilus spindle-shaped virus]|uniref:PCNA n=1 Tax=Nitrosopumilus spindle-shaped virus TaxID=2508184 RepID=A0A514K2S6_9VIRU|nr:hypothetical protein HOV56_gp44 [Nitrosopumilus spindle-shaped virus]YP_010772873.1 hypothetical protein QIT54_gp43 [Nitrosopumilus spindle-shaped virus]QDI73933.1 hypothetical protein [Nitrosopumilus spindle-shaped virus]QDI73981.1 hypothetical protein [Nitrosopumilus spindle-shaped virus]